MAQNRVTSDNPLALRILRSFLHFLDHVELAPGVDAEGIEVAKECLVEAFKLDYVSFARDPDSLIDLFKSLVVNEQKQYQSSRSHVSPPPDSLEASTSLSDQNRSETSKTKDGDWTQDPHSSEGDLTAVSKDELFGKFFAALEKNHYFMTNIDGGDDQEQLEKACRLFEDGFLEMERSGSQQFSLKNLAESLKSLGNKAMQSKQYGDAIELYNCAIAIYEKNAVYYCNRAAAYTQVNKYSEAIQDCLRSIEIDPNYSKAYSRLGLAYYAQGNYIDAIDKGFKKALLLDPNNQSVKENIRVAELKLLEEQHHTDRNQNSRSSQEFPNQYAQGSRSHAGGEPPTFTSMPFNPNNLASMFMNIAANATNQHQGSHPQERQEDGNSTSANEPEIRIGGNNSRSSQEFPNQHAQGSRSHAGGVPPITSMPFNPNDLASMFMNIAANATNQHQGSHPQERQEDGNSTSANEPEIRIGGNVSVNLDQVPQDLTGTFQSLMEVLSGAAPPGQPHDQMNGRTAPN